MPPPALLSGRLHLRAWTPADAAAFHGLWGDPRVIWWGHAATPAESRRQLQAVLARCAGMPAGMGWWAVTPRRPAGDTGAGPGEIVGNAVLQPAPYDESAELGYHLLHRAWGQGYATEAARALLAHGFGTLGLPLISAVVHVDNAPSHRVLGRVGMRVTGPITFNGMPHVRYALTREEARTGDEAASARV